MYRRPNPGNEEPEIETRFKIKDEYKEELRNDPGLLRDVASDLVEKIWSDWQEDHWEGEPEEKYTTADVAATIVTAAFMDNAELYSELTNPPANINVFQNQYFEVEYID